MRRDTGRAMIGGVAWLAALVALAEPARAQPLRSAQPEAGAPLPDLAFEAAKAAFERLPEAERRAIQEALVWTGDHASTADGTFGRRTFEAVQSYQRRAKLPATGLLDRAATANLLASAGRVRAGWEFASVTDPASGVRIGVPRKLLAKASPNGAGGTRYQSADGRVTLDIRSAPGGEAELKALYERNLANPAPGRTVGYKVLRADFFVVSGETTAGRFYTRSAARGGTIRSFSLGYDKALAADLDRVVIAVANSFVPFPDAAASPPALASNLPVPPARAREEARPSPAGFTGLAVSARRVLAPAGAVEGCREPLVDGAPAWLVTLERGLAVLEPAMPRRGAGVPLASGPVDGRVLVVFIAPGEGGRAVAAPAEIASADRLYAPLQEGAAGGVVLDRTGAVAGMVAVLATGTRAVAGLVPPASHRFADVAALRGLIGPDAPPPPSRPAGASEAGSMGAKAAEIAPSLVRIACAAPTRAP